jgi:uncharacterized protein (DUF1800 family)
VAPGWVGSATAMPLMKIPDAGEKMRVVNVTQVALLAASVFATILPQEGVWAAGQTSDAEALHVLNRLGYGPRPGDLERVERMGVQAYIDEQLHPERIALPDALQRQLAVLDTQDRSQRDLVGEYRDAAREVKQDAERGKEQRRAMFAQLALQSGEQRMARAIESPRQLEEVMVEFWFNHFNVFAGKGLDRVLVANYEREAIRPYVLGHFRDLLGATAHHPAMLFYLDNWLSAAPGFQANTGAGQQAKVNGLNENYAREIMELHTLGVDGGYTQADVTALARILTGWTINPRQGRGGSTFYFDERRHDWGDKEWLGNHVGARGENEGEWALDVLARSPRTATHISYQLAQYFVADKPSDSLVERMSKKFLATDGDIRAVLKVMFDSREFREQSDFGNKFKTPYQYVVSAARAAAVPVSNVRPLMGVLNQLGMPLYGCPTPDGYKNTEDAWLNPDAMTRRIGFATALAAGRLPLARELDYAAPMADGQRPVLVQAGRGQTDPANAQALLTALGPTFTEKTRDMVGQSEPQLQAALLLGSPDFMRH